MIPKRETSKENDKEKRGEIGKEKRERNWKNERTVGVE